MEKRDISFRRMLTIVVVCVVIFRIGVAAYHFWDNSNSRKIVRITYDEAEALDELEKGHLFMSVFWDSRLAEVCEVLELRYAENRWQENYRQEKLPDVYVLELDPGNYMNAIRESIVDSGSIYCGGRMLTGDPPSVVQDAKRVDCYWMDQNIGSDTDQFLFLIGENFDYLRFVLITEVNPKTVSEPHDIIDLVFIYAREALP